jgi:hypothetical protein
MGQSFFAGSEPPFGFAPGLIVLMSLGRLFLGGLLSSIARLRFTDQHHHLMV